jgi:hypothetical protein
MLATEGNAVGISQHDAIFHADEISFSDSTNVVAMGRGCAPNALRRRAGFSSFFSISCSSAFCSGAAACSGCKTRRCRVSRYGIIRRQALDTGMDPDEIKIDQRTRTRTASSARWAGRRLLVLHAQVVANLLH